MAEQNSNTQAEGSALQGFIRRDWPYIAMLILAVLGVALASVMLDSMKIYWEILVPCFAAICVWTRLQDAQHQALLGRLIRIEALHWGAVFIAMNVVSLPDVKSMMNVDASALMVMTILALGTFTAGAQTSSWRICVVGAVLGLAVPFVAWLDRSTLLITLASIALVTIGLFIYAHFKTPSAQLKL